MFCVKDPLDDAVCATDVQTEETLRCKDVGVQTTLTGIELAETLSELRRDRKNLKEQLRRRNARVSTLTDMLELLKRNSLLEETVESICSTNFQKNLPFELFVNEIDNASRSNTNKRYSEEIKQFCLTLQFYSPKAYDFLRQRSTLPDPSTIRRWLSTRECKPGILTEVIKYLKENSSKKEFRYLKDVALVYDAMSIRSGRWYCRKEDKFYGYCDLGGIPTDDSEKYATEALFFCIVSYTHKFKVPVAYFLIDKINANLQSQLCEAVIKSLYEAGVVVHSLTSDATSSNIKTYETLMGHKFDFDNLETSFPHPSDSTVRIHCILDPPHLLKLARNMFGENCLSSPKGDLSFNYIKVIHQIQEKLNLKLANKLTSSHIFYKKKKMKVNLAAQTISSRVADTLQFFKQTSAAFKDADATIEFLRIFDRLFDIMNARNKFGKGYKAPMSLKNRVVWESFFEEAGEYIRSLKCDGVDILNHRRKTFAFGFLVNLVSYRSLALDLLCRSESPLMYFLPYKTSQDHAELTFSCVRSRTGHNNNPHALELSWILRRMLFRNSIAPSKNANCSTLGEEYYFGIFSFGDTDEIRTKNESDDIPEADSHETCDDEIEFYLGSLSLNDLRGQILYFISGTLVKDYLEKYPCDDCEDCLLQPPTSADHTSALGTLASDITAFTRLKNRGGLLFVTQFAVDVILYTEKLYSSTVIAGKMKESGIRSRILAGVRKHFIESGRISKLDHPILDTANGERHELKILNFLASKYLLMRIYTQCKKATADHIGAANQIRQQYRHLTLFKGT